MKRTSIDWTASCFMAVLIILVVVGHINTSSFNGPFDLFPPYSFHVAGFAFVSGYLYSEKHDAHPFQYILQRVKKFIIPLFCLTLFFGILTTTLRHFCGLEMGEDFSLSWWVLRCLFGMGKDPLFYPVWFIAPFCYAQCATCLLRWVLNLNAKTKVHVDVLMLIVCMALGGIPMTVGNADPMQTSPVLQLYRTLFFMPWFAIGKFYASHLRAKDSHISSALFLTIVMLLALIGNYIASGNVKYTPSTCKFPNNAVFTYYVTLLGIAFWWRICRIVAPKLGSGGGRKPSRFLAKTHLTSWFGTFLASSFLKAFFAEFTC